MDKHNRIQREKLASSFKLWDGVGWEKETFDKEKRSWKLKRIKCDNSAPPRPHLSTLIFSQGRELVSTKNCFVVGSFHMGSCWILILGLWGRFHCPFCTEEKARNQREVNPYSHRDCKCWSWVYLILMLTPDCWGEVSRFSTHFLLLLLWNKSVICERR